MKGTRAFAAAVAIFALSAISVQAEEWKLDRSHSSVNFTVKHMLVSKVNGQFNDFSATIDLDRQDLSKSSVDFMIKATSINTGNERRDADLRSESFFLVDSFPDIAFKSKRVVPGTGDQFQLIGDLTVRGVTKEITWDCTNNGFVETDRGDRSGFTATTKINRMDYGVKWDAALDNGGLVVSNEVLITVELELVKPKPEAKG